MPWRLVKVFRHDRTVPESFPFFWPVSLQRKDDNSNSLRNVNNEPSCKTFIKAKGDNYFHFGSVHVSNLYKPEYKLVKIMSTHALAKLTATYTDSEPEGDDEDSFEPEETKKALSDHEEQQKEEKEEHTEAAAAAAAPVPPPPPQLPPQPLNNTTGNLEVTSKVAQLVSYNDDAIISDDEFDHNHRYDGDFRISGLDDDLELPPEPTGRCSPTLLEKVQLLHEKVSNGLDMNKLIQHKKEFRNPSIYEKLIQFCGINELGTNYSPDVYDPSKWGKESFYEELAKAQKVEMDRREKEKKERTKVEFVSGTKKQTNDDEQKKRKSKWDQVGPAPAGVLGPTLGLIRPAGLVQASLTSSVTGTKGTSIPAFGSLPRKPRI